MHAAVSRIAFELDFGSGSCYKIILKFLNTRLQPVALSEQCTDSRRARIHVLDIPLHFIMLRERSIVYWRDRGR